MDLRMGPMAPPITQANLATALTFMLLMLGAVAARAQDKKDPPKSADEPAKPPAVKLGLSISDSRAFQGYTLLAPMMSTKTYLIDMDGRVVHTWESDCSPALCAYLLEDGHLLRPGTLRQQGFGAPGAGGRIQEFTWEGELVWDFRFSNGAQFPHHDICRLPNGNVLMIVSERKTSKEAVAAGRRPETVGDGPLQSDCILEVERTGKTSGRIVWEWHAWDHLIQDFDDKMANLGDVAAHPELIDLNFGEGVLASMIAKKEELDKLRSIGYVGDTSRKPQQPKADWLHVNGLSYNADLDQIMLSVHEFSEFWVIDHGTKTAEAAGHKGGRFDKGGDLLYRWGNPRAYRAGTVKDQQLFSQHNAHWIPKELPGEGNMLVFNNGLRRTGGAHSTVDEIVPPVDRHGLYEYSSGNSFGPDKAAWSYAAPKRTDFYSMLISGAQRLPNGNTLICSGINGTIFEVTPTKDTVWKYVNPEKARMTFGFGGPPKTGEIMPPFLRDMLKMTDDQKKQLDEIQKEVDAKLDKVLTEEQKKQLKNMPVPGFGPPGGPGGPPGFAGGQGGPGGPPGGGPGGPGFGPGGFGAPGGGAPVFRAYRYAPGYPGLVKKDLKPGKSIEDLQEPAKESKESKDK
jgi:hypothetical protein